MLLQKKNLRVIKTGAWLDASHEALQFKRVGGGMVVQTRDNTGAGEVTGGKVVSKRAPEVVDEVRLPGRPDIVEHGAHLGAGSAFLDQRYGWHAYLTSRPDLRIWARRNSPAKRPAKNR